MTQDAKEEKYPKRILLLRGIPSRTGSGIFMHEKTEDGSYGGLLQMPISISEDVDQNSPEYDLVLIRVAKAKKKKQGINA